MAEEKELLERGMAVTKQLWGERAGGGGMPAQKLAPDFFKMVTEFCFGGFWSRPGLDVRSRSPQLQGSVAYRALRLRNDYALRFRLASRTARLANPNWGPSCRSLILPHATRLSVTHTAAGSWWDLVDLLIGTDERTLTSGWPTIVEPREVRGQLLEDGNGW